MSNCRIKKPLIIWKALFRAAAGPQTIWCLIVRYSASATQLKNIFLIKPLCLNSTSPQRRSLPLKVLKTPRKSQEAFYFKVNLITKLGMSFFLSVSPPNFKFLIFLSHQLSHFNSGGTVSREKTQQLTERINRKSPPSSGLQEAPFWIMKYCG